MGANPCLKFRLIADLKRLVYLYNYRDMEMNLGKKLKGNVDRVLINMMHQFIY